MTQMSAPELGALLDELSADDLFGVATMTGLQPPPGEETGQYPVLVAAYATVAEIPPQLLEFILTHDSQDPQRDAAILSFVFQCRDCPDEIYLRAVMAMRLELPVELRATIMPLVCRAPNDLIAVDDLEYIYQREVNAALASSLAESIAMLPARDSHRVLRALLWSPERNTAARGLRLAQAILESRMYQAVDEALEHEIATSVVTLYADSSDAGSRLDMARVACLMPRHGPRTLVDLAALEADPVRRGCLEGVAGDLAAGASRILVSVALQDSWTGASR